MAKAVWTNAQIIDQLNSGMRWTQASLTYGFPTSATWMPYAEKNGFSMFSASQQNAASLAIKLWDDLIATDITLASGNTANIKFANTTTNIDYAHAYYPGMWAGAGSVWLNPTYGASWGTSNIVTPVVGQWGFGTYIHELGHALGLDHPGTYNGGSPTYANDALYAQDSQMYTIMSYFTADETGADWVASDGREYFAQTPMLHDVLAIQAMYGAETTTRTGNTVYGFNSNADTWVFDFAQNRHPIVTIWDSAGIDTLDLSGWSYACVINLAPGSYSNADMMTYNIAIAFGAWIENGVGGGGNDQLNGNDLGNSLSGMGGNDVIFGLLGNDMLFGGLGADALTGGAGNDTLDGGDGADTARFSGRRADYSVTWDAATATFTLTDLRGGSPDGVDKVKLVESFVFSDQTVAAASLVGTTPPPPPPPPPPAPTGATAGDDNLTGTAAADQMAGLAGNDTLTGLAGDDLLDGGLGNDRLVGGLGNDTYVVDSLQDVVVEAASQGTDTVRTGLASLTLAVNVENLVYTGASGFSGSGNTLNNVIEGAAGADTLNGWAGNDLLWGRDGVDRLTGGDGVDILVGGAGADVLTGGAGADTFRFLASGDSGTGVASDQITDFIWYQYDKIDLSAIDARTNVAGDQAFSYIAGAAFSGVSGQLRLAGGVLSGDVDGDRVADFEIRMTGVTVLYAAYNFVL